MHDLRRKIREEHFGTGPHGVGKAGKHIRLLPVVELAEIQGMHTVRRGRILVGALQLAVFAGPEKEQLFRRDQYAQRPENGRNDHAAVEPKPGEKTEMADRRKQFCSLFGCNCKKSVS